MDYVEMIRDVALRMLRETVGLPRPMIAWIGNFFNTKVTGEDRAALNQAVVFLQTAIRTQNRDMLEAFYEQFGVREYFPVLYWFCEGMMEETDAPKIKIGDGYVIGDDGEIEPGEISD